MTADVIVIDISKTVEIIVGFGIILITVFSPIIFKDFFNRLAIKYGDMSVFIMVILAFGGIFLGITVAFIEFFPQVTWVW